MYVDLHDPVKLFDKTDARLWELGHRTECSIRWLMVKHPEVHIAPDVQVGPHSGRASACSTSAGICSRIVTLKMDQAAQRQSYLEAHTLNVFADCSHNQLSVYTCHAWLG